MATRSSCVKCSNDNCNEEGNYLHFRLCIRCSAYFCHHCCGLSQKIIKSLNERTDNYWFCPECIKPALHAIFKDKDIEEKCKAYFENLEHRIIKMEENQEIIMKHSNNKVDIIVYDEHLQQYQSKMDLIETNLLNLK